MSPSGLGTHAIAIWAFSEAEMKRLTREAREAATLRIRGERHNVSQFPQDYQQLTQITSTLGKDVKFRRPAEYRASAMDYARRRNLVLGPDEDIDNDQINDVVLYDYQGNPVIVNGYELVPSERPYRMTYQERFPSKKARAEVGGYSGFRRHFHEIDGMPALMETFPAKYPRLKPYTPRTIAPSLYDYYGDVVRGPLIEIIDELLDGRKHLKSTFSIFNVISLCYLDTIIGMLWRHPDNAEAVQHIMTQIPASTDLLFPTHRYELFKTYIRKNQDKIKRLITPIEEEWKGRTLDHGSGTLLATILQPVLPLVPGMPTDIELAGYKLSKDREYLHHINVTKAEISEQMREHCATLKSIIINRIFAGEDEADSVMDTLGPSYQARIERYLDTLLTMDPMNQSKALHALLRDRRHAGHVISYIQQLDPEGKYRPLLELFNRKLAATGYLP